MNSQFDFFGGASARGEPPPPDGFRYRPELIGATEEARLLAGIRTLPFRDFEFRGYTGKRRVVSFGWQYDFTARRLSRVDDIPDLLLPLRAAAADFAGLAADDLRHVLVTEYGPGAAIGWHRDRAVFGEIVGVSLLGACTFRLRREAEGGWERYSVRADARSAYLLSGPARTEWEHSIQPVETLRYSITFRNLRGSEAAGSGEPAEPRSQHQQQDDQEHDGH